MCLAIPGKISALHENFGVPMAKVDFGGITREACLSYVPEARIGDYVLVHVGFAISKVDEEEAAAHLPISFRDGSAERTAGRRRRTRP